MIAVLAATMLVVIGRIYLNAHFVTDVLGGGMLATGMVVAALALAGERGTYSATSSGNVSTIDESGSIDA